MALDDQIHRAVEQRPRAAFAAFVALHAVVWTLLPTLFFRNLPLDLIEALLYGREWQLGYDKLPPLPWWLAEAAHRLFGPDLFYYALSQAAVLGAFVLIWNMARRLIGPLRALLAIMIIDGLHYFTFTAPKFNHDVVQLPFWALAGVSYWAALRRGRWLDWMLLGFAVGMAFWSKYFIVVFVAPLVAFALLDAEARKSFGTPGPYLAAAVALAVAAPHLVWLVQNDFLPFHYADARAAHFRAASDYVIRPSAFLLSQLGFLLPSLLIAAPCLQRDGRRGGSLPRHDTIVAAFDRRIVDVLTWGPVATLVLLSIVTGRATVVLWGYPLWLFLGLWLMMRAPPLAPVKAGRAIMLWAVVFTVFAVAFVVAYDVKPRYEERYVAVLYPGDRLAAEISQRYRLIAGRPLAYVVATMWTGGNIAHYAPEQPRVLIDGRPERAPWIDLGDLRAKGAAVVWTDREADTLRRGAGSVAEDAEPQPSFTLPMRLGQGVVTVHWALLRPRPIVAGTR